MMTIEEYQSLGLSFMVTQGLPCLPFVPAHLPVEVIDRCAMLGIYMSDIGMED